MPGYTYALAEEAVAVFASLSPPRRRALLRIFAQLAQFPAQAGDYRESGASGRRFEIKLFDDILLTWWTDHAEKEVRIIRIEEVD